MSFKISIFLRDVSLLKIQKHDKRNKANVAGIDQKANIRFDRIVEHCRQWRWSAVKRR